MSGMDVSHAQLSNLGAEVELVDPAFPWTIRVELSENAFRPEVLGIYVWSRTGEPITASVLAQIPIRQVARVAASALKGGDETLYRMLAAPRPKGCRSWPPDHYQRVVRVASWARRIGRSGGAAGAVAEFWGVDYRTARRWLSRATVLGLAEVQP